MILLEFDDTSAICPLSDVLEKLNYIEIMNGTRLLNLIDKKHLPQISRYYKAIAHFFVGK